MLSTMRSSWFLFALLAIIALAQAFSVEDALNIDGINAYLHHGIKRQAEGTGASPSTSAPAPSTSSEQEPEPETSNSASASPPASPTPSSSASAEDPPSDEPTPTPTPTPSQSRETSAAPADPSTSSEQAEAPSTTPSQRVSVPITTDKPLVRTDISRTTTVITIISNGQTMQSTQVSTRTNAVTTGTVRETILPNTGDTTGGGGGLSSTNKSIIGGVVGGIGGAILLGGIAIVCWRMWGRKKRVTEDDVDLMANTGAALGDKSSNSASPFQTNLEQYHNPGGRPNAAANF